VAQHENTGYASVVVIYFLDGTSAAAFAARAGAPGRCRTAYGAFEEIGYARHQR